MFIGRLDVLIRMAVSHDDATQEHAVEAIAELLTIPAIQVSEKTNKKTLTLSQEHPFVCRKWILLPAQLTFQMFTLLQKDLYSAEITWMPQDLIDD